MTPRHSQLAAPSDGRAQPVDFERFVAVVRQIDDFFITVARLPG